MDMLLASLVILTGAFIQTSIGFGLAIIAAPILFFIDPAYVPAPITVSALCLSILNTLRYRHGISLRGLQYAIVGRVPGSLAGAALLIFIDKSLLALWIGISVLAAVAVSMTSLRWQPTSSRMMLAGFMSGFMGTSSSIGGPPMALLWQHQEVNLIRANLAAFFTVSCVISLVILLPTEYMGWFQLQLSLPLLPATVLGFFIAQRTAHYLPHKVIRTGSLLLCSVSGLLAVLSFFW